VHCDSSAEGADDDTGAAGGTDDVCDSVDQLLHCLQRTNDKQQAFAKTLDVEFVGPLNLRVQSWKKETAALDRDFTRESDRMRKELLRLNQESLKTQRKLQKGLKDVSMDGFETLLHDMVTRAREFEVTEKRLRGAQHTFGA
jgi:hypothetical protein